MSKDNYIWIYGENRAESACENAFNFWRYGLTKDDSVDKYFILKKNKYTLEVYESLSKIEKEFILWHNSKKHKKIFEDADMCFISDSFEDVCPTKGTFRKKIYPIDKPLIFLQKDSNSLFNTRFTGESQNNNIFRFCVYDKNNMNIFKEKNNFRDYQLRYVKFPLKFDSKFIEEDESTPKDSLVFVVEWRYYDSIRKDFVNNLVGVLKSKELNEYLKNNNIKLKLYLHRYYKKNKFRNIFSCANDNIEIFETNVVSREDVLKCKLLITDYNSYAYDFTLLNRPVILYQPDFDFVKSKHQFLIDENELFNIKDSSELISAIVNEKEVANPVLEMWDDDIYDVKSDDHLKELYEYFLEKQENKITFIGYNFFGVGGTVSATKALSEGLMQKDCFVELYSILKTNSRNSKPYGINFTHAFYRHTISVREKVKYKLFKLTRRYGYIGYEENVDGLNPYSNYHLKRTLKNIKSKTVVSTRESLHLYLDDCRSDFIKDKIYFFHAPADTLDVMYPGLIKELKKKTFEKAIFVTESNRQALKDLLDYSGYNNYIIIGNALEQVKVIPREDIHAVPKKDKYVGIYLLRLSRDRIDDLNNLIEFAKHLKKKNVTNIVIDVFGGGNYVEDFMDIVYANNLDNIINYRGKTNNPFGEIKNHDFMADFTLNHSFGMIYIEGVLGGRKVFCMENQGSLEVMEGIDNTYIESFDWLVDQINDISDISEDELKENYDIISSKFSQKAVSEKFLDFLDK